MSKFLFNASDDQTIQQAIDDIKSIDSHTEERLEFLRKQALDLIEGSSKDSKEMWDRITLKLKELNKIPQDYERETSDFSLELNKESGDIFMINDEELKKRILMERIMKSIPDSLVDAMTKN